jgi:hypothetical protein
MALARCILGKFLRVVCHCFPLPLNVPTFAARCLHVSNNASAPSSKRWNCGREWCLVILSKWRLFYAIQGSFTCRKYTTWGRRLYFPSEGRHAEDFFAWKIQRFQPGLNPWTWVTEASMLTTRPPKPLHISITLIKLEIQQKPVVLYEHETLSDDRVLNPLAPELFFKSLHTLNLKIE